MLDQTDKEILRLLTADARMQWQDIGNRVHMTGQAVRNRVDRMIRDGVIRGFTVSVAGETAGNPVTAFVTFFMKSTEHQAFRRRVCQCPWVEELHRISGNGCYLFRTRTPDQKSLMDFLETLLCYGNYSINLSMDEIPVAGAEEI